MDPVSLLASASRAGFRLGSRARSARFFHPRGVVLAGRLRVTGAGPLPTGETDCVVRLSKAFGTPGDLPDILGVALRFTDAGPEGVGPVDVLVASSSGARGWRRFTLWPAAAWGRVSLTSLLAWEAGPGPLEGERATVVVEVDDPRLTTPDVKDLVGLLPVVLSVRVDGGGGQVLQRGEVEVTGPDAPAVDFDPVLHEPPGWRFVPRWVARVRVASYAGSREGRSRASSDSASWGANPFASLSK
ncbi:hypothetical protein [Nocardioides solisilvae]|uniref:hypothetical protein n=1 Tax=Nocardioides solisilvae TaxID=1542435 RepID=UPI000D745820|nr:hypothetical protein [Nocardioides solisilvae]